MHFTLQNVATGMRSAGGAVENIGRLTFYVVGWNPAMANALFDGTRRARESDGYSHPLAPITVIGVQALWVPELLVEIEATAVLD